MATTTYDAYIAALSAMDEAKDQLKTLRRAGESAALAAKKNTVGTTAEKIAAIRSAWVPFNEAIKKTEQAIEQYRVTSDEVWNA